MSDSSRSPDREELPELLDEFEKAASSLFSEDTKGRSFIEYAAAGRRFIGARTAIESRFAALESENGRLKETALSVDGVLSRLEDEMHSCLDQPVTGDFMGLTRAWRQILEKYSRRATSEETS